jgi:hypothetical protein
MRRAACVALLAMALPAAAERFVHKQAVPDAARSVIVTEGDFEARSIGSYAVRLYQVLAARPGDDGSFFVDGIVQPRDGGIERLLFAPLLSGEPPLLVVVMRSAGTGNYLSADAFAVHGPRIEHRASVRDLPAQADPVDALATQLRAPQAK